MTTHLPEACLDLDVIDEVDGRVPNDVLDRTQNMTEHLDVRRSGVVRSIFVVWESLCGIVLDSIEDGGGEGTVYGRSSVLVQRVTKMNTTFGTVYGLLPM